MSTASPKQVSGASIELSTRRAGLFRLWPVALSFMLAFGVYRFGLEPLFGIAAVLVASWLAYRFRVAATVALAISLLVPQLLLMTSLLPEGWGALSGGVGMSDLILVGMWGASAAFMVNGRSHTREARLLTGISLVVSGVLLVAVARNWGSYGLSAIGEFRFRFLIMGLPVYLALGLSTTASRARIVRLLTWGPILGVVLALPVVSLLKGWALGETSRFYPSAISLALLYGALWIGLSRSGADARRLRILIYCVYLLVSIVVVKDAHRSVWLVAAVCLALLLWLGAIRGTQVWSRGLFVLSGSLAAIAILGLAGTDVLAYVGARGSAFVNPVADPTSLWRISVWKAYIGPWLTNPLFGQGFGGYWDVYVPELGARIITSPHSMYVQTLVKLGLVGMAGLLAWFSVSLSILLRERFRVTGSSELISPLVIMGILAVVGQLTYGMVYALDFWSLAWVGVALAEVLQVPKGLAAS